MLPNNTVYKGYRLTAKVERLSVPGISGPAFTATLIVDTAANPSMPALPRDVPHFVDGSYVFSPAEAVHVAMLYGREIVELLDQERAALAKAA
jgi:hypothetical protein